MINTLEKSNFTKLQSVECRNLYRLEWGRGGETEDRIIFDYIILIRCSKS